MSMTVDLAAVAARQRARLADALYELDAVKIALDEVVAERDELKAELGRLGRESE